MRDWLHISMGKHQKYKFKLYNRTVWRNEKRFGFSIKRKRGSAELELYEYAFSLGKYKDVDKKYAGKELPGWRMKKE